MSELKFACPACGQHLQCDLAMAGKQMQCPNCQVPFLAPALPAGAPPPAPTAHAAPPPPPPGMHKAPPPPPPGHGAPPPPPPPGLTVAPSGGKPGAPTPAPVFTSVNKAPQGGTKKKTQPLAIVSLVCGLLPFLFPVGIVCGHMARAKIRKDPSLGGKGMAMAGLILSYLSLAGVVACVAALMMGLSFLKKLSEESAKAGAGTNQVAGASANGEAPAVREHKKGASRPGPSTPEEAARAFIEASKKGDVKATLGLMTQKAQGIIGGALGTNLPPTMPAVPNTPGAPAIEYNVGEVTTNADVATVQLHIAAGAIKQPMQLKMRQENGSWRIFGEALFADEKQPGLLLDFENLPDQATLRAQLAAVMAKQMGAAGGGEQSLEPFTKDQFDALGKLDLEAMGQPAIEVLTPLAKGLGLALTQNAKQETQLNKPVTFKGGKAPLEIIEDIGRQIERVPAYSGLRLTFRRDTRVNPVAFAGPLMLEVESAESSATGAGQLKLALRGYGLPVPLANLLREQGSVILSVTSIGDGQKDYADRSGRITLAADRSPGALVASVVVPLTGMDGGVAKIPVARLKATLTLPSAVEKIEFARLEAGASEKAGSVQVTLTKITGASYQFEIVGAPAGRVQFSAHNDQGATLKATSNVTSAAPEKSTVNVLVTGKPQSLTAHVATTVAETPVEFELHDIPVKGGAAPAATVAAPATVAKAPTTTTPGAPAPAAKAPAGTGAVNLFKDARPVASSTAEATELVVTSVNDGNVKTRWNSNNNDAKGAWVGGRWEDPVTINRVVIHQAFDRITGFRVQKLDEEKDEWVDVTVVEGPAFAQVKGRIAPGKNPMDSTVNPVFNVNLPAPVTTRGLRMLVTDVSKFVYSISVSELEAY